MAGMPPGFAELIRRKYQIMQQGADTASQQADTQRIGVEAAARLDNVRAGLLPAESKANIGLTEAQAGLAQANTRNIDETTRWVGPTARANIGNLNANAYNSRMQGGLYSSEAESKNQLNRLLGGGFGFRFGL